MHITGHKIIKEPVQIKVDNTEIWNLVARACFMEYGYDFVKDGVYHVYLYEPPHVGKDMYICREATEEEANVYKALELLKPYFFEGSKDK